MRFTPEISPNFIPFYISYRRLDMTIGTMVLLLKLRAIAVLLAYSESYPNKQAMNNNNIDIQDIPIDT